MSETKHPSKCLVEIELKDDGQGRIVVDGHDLSNKAYKVELVGHVGEPTEVVLYMRCVEIKVLASAWITHKMLTLDPDTASEAQHNAREPVEVTNQDGELVATL